MDGEGISFFWFFGPSAQASNNVAVVAIPVSNRKLRVSKSRALCMKN